MDSEAVGRRRIGCFVALDRATACRYLWWLAGDEHGRISDPDGRTGSAMRSERLLMSCLKRLAGDCTRPLLFRRTTLVGDLLWRIATHCSSGPVCSMDFVCSPLRRPDSGCLRTSGSSRMTHQQTRRGRLGTTGVMRARDEVVPEFVSWFEYELSGVQLLSGDPSPGEAERIR